MQRKRQRHHNDRPPAEWFTVAWDPWAMVCVLAHYGHDDAACMHVIGDDRGETVYAALLAVRDDPDRRDPDVRACLGVAPLAQAPSWRRFRDRRPLLWLRAMLDPLTLSAVIVRFGRAAWRCAPRAMRAAMLRIIEASPEAQRRAAAIIAPPTRRAAPPLAASPEIAAWQLERIGRAEWRRRSSAERRRLLAAVPWTPHTAARAAAVCGHVPLLWRSAARTRASCIAYLQAVAAAGDAVPPRLIAAAIRIIGDRPDDAIAIAAIIGHHPRLWRIVRRAPGAPARYLDRIGRNRWSRLDPSVQRRVIADLPPNERWSPLTIAVIGAPSPLDPHVDPNHRSAACCGDLPWTDQTADADLLRLQRLIADRPRTAAAIAAAIGDHSALWRVIADDPTAIGEYILALGRDRWKRLRSPRRRAILRRWLRTLPSTLTPVQRRLLCQSPTVIGFHAAIWRRIASTPDAVDYLDAVARRCASRLSDAARNAIAAARPWSDHDLPLLARVIGLHPLTLHFAVMTSQAATCLAIARDAGHIRRADPRLDDLLESLPWRGDDAVRAADVTGRATPAMWRACLAESNECALRLLALIATDVATPNDAARRAILAAFPPPPLSVWTIAPIIARIGWTRAFQRWTPSNDPAAHHLWRIAFEATPPLHIPSFIERILHTPPVTSSASVDTHAQSPSSSPMQ